VGTRISESEEEMKCVHCGGEMHRGRAPFQIDREGYVLTLQAVPAWICGQCGESFFEDRAVDAIQEVIRSMDAKARDLAVSA